MTLNSKLAAGLACLLAAPHMSSAQQGAPTGPLGEPTGSFVIQSGGTNAFGSGWGTGTLRFQNQSFQFRADGVQPISSTESGNLAEGLVYNLVALNDFSGFYSTIGEAPAETHYLQNEHYVVILVTKSKKGVMFRSMDKPVRVDLMN